LILQFKKRAESLAQRQSFPANTKVPVTEAQSIFEIARLAQRFPVAGEEALLDWPSRVISKVLLLFRAELR